jgi:hypothetical protein
MHGSGSNRSCVTTCNLTISGALLCLTPSQIPGFSFAPFASHFLYVFFRVRLLYDDLPAL